MIIRDGIEWLDVKETMTYLGKSQKTLYNWRHNGILKGKKVGGQWEYKKSDVLLLLE